MRTIYDTVLEEQEWGASARTEGGVADASAKGSSLTYEMMKSQRASSYSAACPFPRLSVVIVDHLLRLDGHVYNIGGFGLESAFYIQEHWVSHGQTEQRDLSH